MKFFAVILALVAFSGCHGVPLDSAQTDWETMVDNVRDYFTDLNSKADRLVKDLQQTQVVRELDTLTLDTMSELAIYRDSIQTNLGPYTQERAEQLERDLQVLGAKLSTKMVTVGEHAAEYSRELQSVLEQSANDARTTFNAYARKIRKRVNKDKELFNKNVAAYVEELQTRTSDNVQAILSQMQPYLTQVGENAEAKVSTINRLLKTQADNAAEKIQISTEDIRQQLDKTAEDLRSTLEEKVEEVRDWFTSNFPMFRE